VNWSKVTTGGKESDIGGGERERLGWDEGRKVVISHGGRRTHGLPSVGSGKSLMDPPDGRESAVVDDGSRGREAASR